MGSRVATVVGDEAGVGGGVASQVIKGFCKPLVPVTTVRINKQFANHNDICYMLMNGASPEGPFNTIGQVLFLGPMFFADVGPAGTIPAESNPPPQSESFVEGGCMPKLDQLAGAGGGGLADIVGLAQKAYSLATTDWSNPSAVLGAIGGVAGMAGLGGLSQAVSLASGAVGLATADWSNPGSALGAAMAVAGPMLGGAMGGGGGGGNSSSGMGTINGIAGPIPVAHSSSSSSGPKLPPGVVPCF
jgi:hypothetical protein